MRYTAAATQPGTERERWGFLWFPKKIGAEWRWLEHAGWVQRRIVLPHEDDGTVAYWENMRWVPDRATRKGPSA